MGFSNPSSDLSAVPLFPLPNVVLFPRAVLPLHIFESRYKAMTANVLSGSKQIAMALLRPGWEKLYYGTPAIEQVVCVGTVLSHEKLPDGTYNFLLQGHTRAKIVRELRGRDVPYRVAELEKVISTVVPAEDLKPHRRRMVDLFAKDKLSQIPLAGQILRILSSDLPTEDVADLIAFAMFDDTLLKQSLLEEIDVLHRVQRILAELEGIRPRVRPPSDPSQANLN